VTGSILNLTYGYDANGNITSILDTVNPSGGEVMGPPGTYTYQTGTNKLIHIDGTPPIDFGYDANANITTENAWTYVYDLSNQLIRVLDNSNQVAEYTYNGAGQRITKVTQTETRIFHYDLWGHLIAETNQTGQMLAEYIYLGDQLLAMIRGGQVYYFHNDHLGTPQVLTNDSQAISWKAVYTPFGEAVPSIQTVENPFRFPGQYYDPDTGLHYNDFRYYNPQTGRYITPDPIGLEGGMNLFAYVESNPINSTDPLGLDPFIVTINYWPSQYGSFTMVWNKSLLPSFYTSGTLGYTGKIALPFVYTYKYGQHPMLPPPDKTPYPALNLYTLSGSRDIPAFDINTFWFTYISGLNVHKGYSKPNSGSTGCHVIPVKNWNDFMKNIPKGSSGLYMNMWFIPIFPFILP
jgi:RHS repeat-associated protein